MRELNRVYQEKDGLRQFLASMVLLGYHLVVAYFLGNFDDQSNLKLCKGILDEKLQLYPRGVFFLFFKGRYHFIQGQMPQAKEAYLASCSQQDQWPQFHHVCNYKRKLLL